MTIIVEYLTLRVARAIKMNLANEGLEARKKDEEVAAKKRKAEEDKQWEGWCCSSSIYFFLFNVSHIPQRKPRYSR